MYVPQLNGQRLVFHNSGKLYKSAMVPYDVQTGSLWSQLLQRAITGPLAGTRLDILPVDHTTWKDWKRRHPQTLVLSNNTGFTRDYGLDPYRDYFENGEPVFRRPPKGFKSKANLRAMERVLGVQIDGQFKAYSFSFLKRQASPIADEVSQRQVLIYFDRQTERAYVTDPAGSVVASITTFWFAWEDFYPDTEIVSGH